MAAGKPVTLDTAVEDLVYDQPAAIGFLAARGIVCIVCGEAYWGTLGQLIQQKNLAQPENIVADLNAYLQQVAQPGDD